MYPGLFTFHSLLRWIILVLLLAAIVKALAGWLGKQEFTKADKMLSMFAMVSCHIQMVIGFGLYFLSPWVQFGNAMQGPAEGTQESARFWTVEHLTMMMLGIILITIGYSTAKRMTDATSKHKRIAILYLIGLVLILSRIPWWRVFS